jgi:hypothetical protein
MRPLFLGATALTALAACSDNHNSSTGDASVDAVVDAVVSAVDCTSAVGNLDKAICQANGFLGTLATADVATANPAFTDMASRTQWSNLPGVTRAGIKMGSLSAASQAAALALMSTVLSSAGVADLTGVRNADDYLASMSGSGGGGPGGGGGGYGSTNYYVAIFGTPSTTGDWAIMFGGHHMAYNLTYTNGVAYPTPNHLGVEPKAAFTINNGTFMPMADEAGAMVAVFNSLDTTALDTGYLQNQTFSDVLIGPVEYGSGSSALAKAKFPTGANRTGVLVSSLTTDQQALVTTAIQQWVADYDPSIATDLLTAYTSAAAYQDTYVAWGGTQASGIDVDENGFYMRIDGPRVWIEVACQAGVVIQGATHYHSIYRDKTFDYANTL